MISTLNAVLVLLAVSATPPGTLALSLDVVENPRQAEVHRKTVEGLRDRLGLLEPMVRVLPSVPFQRYDCECEDLEARTSVSCPMLTARCRCGQNAAERLWECSLSDVELWPDCRLNRAELLALASGFLNDAILGPSSSSREFPVVKSCVFEGNKTYRFFVECGGGCRLARAESVEYRLESAEGSPIASFQPAPEMTPREDRLNLRLVRYLDYLDQSRYLLNICNDEPRTDDNLSLRIRLPVLGAGCVRRNESTVVAPSVSRL